MQLEFGFDSRRATKLGDAVGNGHAVVVPRIPEGLLCNLR